MTEVYEPFQVTVVAQQKPVVTAILPSTGTGSTPSVMWYNVKTMYGADNSGNIDSTTVIQNAINAANTAGGGVVYFPPGTYKISAPLVVYGGSQLRGDGDGNTIINQVSANANCFTGTDVNYFKVSNIQLNGPGVTGSGKGIQLKLSSHSSTGYLHFEDVRVQHFAGDGIDIDSPTGSVFDRVVTSLNKGNGWNVHSATSGNSCTWDSCYSNSNTLAGYSQSGMNYSDMNGCASNGNGTGYNLTNCQSFTLNSCGAEANAGDNFIISGGTDIILIAPRTFQNAHYGIHLTGNVKNCVIVGAVEGGPLPAAVNFVITDAGTSCSVMNVNNISPNLYNGSTTVLNDGAGNAYVPGTLYLNSGAAITFGAAGDTDLYRKGPSSLATDGTFAANGIDTTSFATASVVKSGAYTLTLNDNVVLCNATGGAFTVTLPNSTAASMAGTIFLVKKTDASINTVTLAAVAGQTIDGKATATLTTQYAFIAVQSDGANWQIVGGASSSVVVSGTVAWYNVRMYGADNTGTSDSYQAINNAIAAANAAGGGIVYFPAGKYMLSNQIAYTNNNNITLLGDGQSSILLPTASFAGGTVINVAGGNANAIYDLVIQMPSTTATSNPSCYGIVLQGGPMASNVRIANVKVMYTNNYALSFFSGAGNVAWSPVVEDFHAVGCTNGINVNGAPNTPMNGVFENINIELFNGSYGMVFTDVQDVRVSNLYVSSTAATSASVIVQGACSGIQITNSRLICGSTNQANLLIQTANSNAPVGVAVSNTVISKGANCCNIMNNSKQVSFSNCEFINALGHGLFTGGSADQVTVTGCTFAGNGSSNNSSYDIYAGSTGTIVITGCQFLSPVGTVTGTVVKSVIFNYGASVFSVCDGNYFANGQGSSWPAGSPPRTAVGNTGDPFAAVGAITAWFDVRKYGADGSNGTAVDSTAGIQAAINAASGSYAGGVVYIPRGVYKISAPLTITGSNQLTLMGEGNHSWISILPAFVGAAAVIVTGGPADYYAIRDLYFTSQGWNTAPACNAINLVDTWNAKVDNVVTNAFNGYSVSATSDANGANFYTQITRVTSINGRGGINIQGTTVSGGNAATYASIANCIIHQNQSLPGINFQDAIYNNVENVKIVGNQGPCIVISGDSGEIYVNNSNLGAYGQNTVPSVTVQASGGNSPSDIYISNTYIAGGSTCLTVTAASRMTISGCTIGWASLHGAFFDASGGGTIAQVLFVGCHFMVNGRTSSATVGPFYDLLWTGTGRIMVASCHFASGVGNGGVAKSANFTAGTSIVSGCSFWNGVGTAFATYPTWVYGSDGELLSNFGIVSAGTNVPGTVVGRFVGASGGNGPPGAGTFNVGDTAIDPKGQIYICTVAGSPGTWTGIGPYTVATSANPSYTIPNDNLAHNIVGAVVTLNVQPGWDVIVNYSSFGTIAEGNTAAHAVLGVNISIDGAAATASPGYLTGRNSGTGYACMISNFAKFTGLSAGNHTFQLICQWNGTASQAFIYQTQISATASRPPM